MSPSSILTKALIFALGCVSFIVGQEGNIVDVAVSNQFNTLVAAVTAADLVDVFQGDGPFTVFAPTDEAFAKLPSGVLDFLLLPENKDVLAQVLTYHVISGAAIAAMEIPDGAMPATVQGETITLRKEPDGFLCEFLECAEVVMVNDAKVIVADVEATNGIIHVIDNVLIPASIEVPDDIVSKLMAEQLMTLIDAILAAELMPVLRGAGPFTLLAPSESAWTALPTGTLFKLLQPENKDLLTSILTYHVIAGKVKAMDIYNGLMAQTVNGESVEFRKTMTCLKVQGSNVIKKDIIGSNGVVHVIDSVLLPPGVTLDQSIVTTAIKNGLSTLVTAVQAANLVDTFDLPFPVTVFAPVNGAFADIQSVVNQLLANPDALGRVLKYHVVAGEVFASDVLEAVGGSIATASGNQYDITMDPTSGNLQINGANILIANVNASNGVVHVIDSVLIPPDDYECEDTGILAYVNCWR